jgi:hypothetical protein
MGTLTFLEWLRQQLAAEGYDVYYDRDFEDFVNHLTNFQLLEYSATYQRETQK